MEFELATVVLASDGGGGGPRSRWQLMMDPCGGTGQWLWTILASDGGSWSWGQLTIDWLQQDSLIYSVPPLQNLNFDNVLIYTWHLLHLCPSWERDPSHVALSEVSTFFLPVKRVFFCSFSLLLLRVKGRGCHTLLKPYETNCGLWIWAIQIKFDWLNLIDK